MITQREMEYLVSIYKTKSILKASIESNVSQPAMTMQLNKIEAMIGIKIFNRERNNTTPTPIGRKIIEKCQEIMIHFKDLEKIAANAKNIEVKIGIIPTISPYLLPKIASKISSNSKIKTYFYELKTDDIIQQLKNGTIDCGIIASYPDVIKFDFNVQNLYQEELVFASPKKSNIDLESAIKENKIILLEDGNCINISITEICKRVNKNTFSATSIEVVKAMIESGNYCGILPKYSLDSMNQKFKIMSIENKKYRQISLISKNSITEEFADIFKPQES